MKKTLLALFFLLSAATALTQNVLAILPTQDSKVSIVREYSESQFLVYNEGAAGGPNFILADLSTSTYYSMSVPWRVYDLEVVGKTAYFCGGSGGWPVAGWFNINALFFAGGSITYCTMPQFPPCVQNSSGIDEILSLKKLEVIDYGSAYNHLVMVGEAKCLVTSSDVTCIAEIYHDGTGWRLNYQVEHEDIFHYDDIAVTSSEVVVVGHKAYTEGEYVTSFPIPALNGHIAFPTPPLYPPYYNHPTYASGGPMYSPHMTSELLTEDISGTDYFATVCQAKYCLGYGACYEATFINIYHGIGTLVYKGMINDYHDLTYRELKYQPHKNSFLLLMDDCQTNMHNGYYEFELDNTMSYVTNAYFHQDNAANEFFSIDRHTSGGMKKQSVLSGRNSEYKLAIWNHDIYSQKECSKTYDVPVTPVTPYYGLFEYGYPSNTISLPVSLYKNRIEREEINVKCNEK